MTYDKKPESQVGKCLVDYVQNQVGFFKIVYILYVLARILLPACHILAGCTQSNICSAVKGNRCCNLEKS